MLKSSPLGFLGVLLFLTRIVVISSHDVMAIGTTLLSIGDGVPFLTGSSATVAVTAGTSSGTSTTLAGITTSGTSSYLGALAGGGNVMTIIGGGALSLVSSVIIYATYHELHMSEYYNGYLLDESALQSQCEILDRNLPSYLDENCANEVQEKVCLRSSNDHSPLSFDTFSSENHCNKVKDLALWVTKSYRCSFTIDGKKLDVQDDLAETLNGNIRSSECIDAILANLKSPSTSISGSCPSSIQSVDYQCDELISFELRFPRYSFW